MEACIEKVKDLLIEQRWEEADSETERLIFSFCNYKDQQWLKLEDIDLIPLETLAHLENLWTDHSEGRFGFRSQAQIHSSIRERIKSGSRDNLKDFISGFLHGTNDSMSSREALMVPYFYNVEVGWIEGHPMDSFGAYGRNKSYEELTFDLSAPVGHLPCRTWWTLVRQTKQVPPDVLFKKYGVLGFQGSLVKYNCSVELHFFKRVQIACQKFG